MKIGIIGIGNIGKTLATKLSAAGHEVKVANSRGPETIGADVLSTGARAVTTADAVVDVDALILSIPLQGIPALAPLMAKANADTVIIDTSNYYPMRDGQIAALNEGQVESEWVSAQLGRPVAKAWNAIGAGSLATKGKPAGDPDRIAIPVAGNSERERAVAMTLVEDTGLDAVDAGSLAESWRQQGGAPCYCTDLSRDQMPAALAAAEAARLPARRDLVISVVIERMMGGTSPVMLDAEHFVRVARAVFL
ncbi:MULTISPECIES: NADPH-dependent F420 reductase [unclassified Methylobacterium]|uniref:NADPH-dependent F420 reductase n=1 Tax=unclassified Methylobacterium TaxID=2615210 RepID=UPI00036799A6|nr:MULTISPECIES: NAD(P)-binding domain-containing protein [unclassified Methylobacterium]KQP47045.1 NADP oxidoreductase [Methylobacterium sp. Leaf106]